PNHHASFHIYDYLVLFGPVHSWWTFPFEQLIGVLQRLPNNHKSGELETTMLHTYIKGAKLRAWLSRPQCLSAVQECKILLDRAYGTEGDAQNTTTDPLEDDVRPPDTVTVTIALPDLRELTNQRMMVLHAHLRHAGVVYSQSSSHVGNSQILFYPQGNWSLQPVPGTIKYIYQADGSLAFAVRRQRPLTSSETIQHA
ncbi:hypothetical protein HD554DRAFT_2026214, partial [Boletus coccyginus]